MSLNDTLSASSQHLDLDMPQLLFSRYLVCEGMWRNQFRTDTMAQHFFTASSDWFNAAFGRVVIGQMWSLRFFFTTFCDWSKKLPPLTQPIRCKTKTNRDLVTRVFPRLAPVTCICFEFLLVHCFVYVCCDWPLYKLLWFCFYWKPF